MNKIIVANWKMNPSTLKEAKELFDFASSIDSKHEVIVCPPFVYLEPLLKSLETINYKLKTKLGSQNCHWEEKGAYTGEISPYMLKDLGVKYVIVGHSERRWQFGETDEMVNQKVLAVFNNKMIPVLAVGEREKDENKEEFVINQVEKAVIGVSKEKLANIIFAYEPVWAIDTGLADNPDNALSMALLIRKTASKIIGDNAVSKLKVLYGGSVDSKNVAGFLNQDGIDGLLIGGASVKREEFKKILEL